jgi:hypothetical protein
MNVNSTTGWAVKSIHADARSELQGRKLLCLSGIRPTALVKKTKIFIVTQHVSST